MPTFTITAKIIALIAEISRRLGQLLVSMDDAIDVHLRRINRIRTIQGSLSIEGNTLSIEQITAILDGKRVIAPPGEIQEVRNAIKAYDSLDRWQPHVQAHLLDAHRIIMHAALDNPGMYRTGGVGVMSGQTIVHLGPPADRVPFLMNDLLEWFRLTDHHPLICGSVFHYEFEFIHPFEDGNGRMGRLWPAMAHGLIEMTVPDKPNSRFQKYRLTQRGKDFLRTD